MNMNKIFFPLSLTAVMIFSANVAMGQAGNNYFAFDAECGGATKQPGIANTVGFRVGISGVFN